MADDEIDDDDLDDDFKDCGTFVCDDCKRELAGWRCESVDPFLCDECFSKLLKRLRAEGK